MKRIIRTRLNFTTFATCTTPLSPLPDKVGMKNAAFAHFASLSNSATSGKANGQARSPAPKSPFRRDPRDSPLQQLGDIHGNIRESLRRRLVARAEYGFRTVAGKM